MEELEYYNATKNGVTVTIKNFSPGYDFFKEYGTKFSYSLCHPDMTLGQKKYELIQSAFDSWEEYGYALQDYFETDVLCPIYLYQICYGEPVKLSTKPFKDEFNSMQIGFAFIDQDDFYDFCQENGLEQPDPLDDYEYEQFLTDVTENYLKPILEEEVEAYEVFLEGKAFTVQVNDKTYGPFYMRAWINKKTLEFIPQEFVEEIRKAQRLRIEKESY